MFTSFRISVLHLIAFYGIYEACLLASFMTLFANILVSMHILLRLPIVDPSDVACGACGWTETVLNNHCEALTS
jgi:hypothetical protein